MARPRRSVFDQVLAEAGFPENLPPSEEEQRQATPEPVPEPVKEPEQEPTEEPVKVPAEEPVKVPAEEPEPAPEPAKESESVAEPAVRSIESLYSEGALELTDEEREGVLRSRLKAVLDVPKVKGQIPTLVRFRQDGQVPVRAVIVEIGENELLEGWRLYKSFQKGIPDAERYLLMVYDLARHEIPRLYRTVAEVRLE